jgi:hypothetical protein
MALVPDPQRGLFPLSPLTVYIHKPSSRVKVSLRRKKRRKKGAGERGEGRGQRGEGRGRENHESPKMRSRESGERTENFFSGFDLSRFRDSLSRAQARGS